MFPAMPDSPALDRPPLPSPAAGGAAVANASGSASLDPQDALPESNWGPRRWYVFLTTAGAFLLVLYGMSVKADAGVLIALVVLVCLMALFYLVAPSAEQFGKIAQAVSAMKGGVTFRSSSSADVDSGRVASSASAGPETSKGSIASE